MFYLRYRWELNHALFQVYLLLAWWPSGASRQHYWVCKFLVTFGFIKLKFISGHSTIIECRGGADDAAARRAVRAARP